MFGMNYARISPLIQQGSGVVSFIRGPYFSYRLLKNGRMRSVSICTIECYPCIKNLLKEFHTDNIPFFIRVIRCLSAGEKCQQKRKWPGSPGIPGPDSTTGNFPVNDTVTGVNDSLSSVKVYDYEAEMQRIPEVSTWVMNPNENTRYRVLLDKLNTKHPGAAR